MPGNPIPDDFDLSQGLTCYRIMWPRSEKWQWLLAGLLSSPARGRFWEASTGSIHTAQEIGNAIWDQSTPVQPCDGFVTREEYDELKRKYDALLSAASGGGGALIESDEDMGQVVTDVTYSDGILTVYFGPCCKKDFLIADMPPEPLPNDDLPPEVVPEPPGVACRKAYYIVYHLQHMGELLRDDLDLGDLFSAYPWITWDAVDLLAARLVLELVDLANLSLLWGETAPDDWQRVICRLSKTFENNYGLSSVEWTALKNAIDTELNAAEAGFFHSIIDAAGPGDLDTLAKRSVAMTYQPDCGCPDDGGNVIVPPITADWIYDMDFRAGPWGWQILAGNPAHYVPGEGYKVDDVPQWGSLPTITRNIEQTGGTLRWMRIEWSAWPSATTWSAENWLQVAAGSDWNEVLAPFKPSNAEKLLWIDLGQGQIFQVNGGQATNASSGPATLARLTIAGTGTPPFPSADESDPVYTP